jgi:hypothetical protein
MSRTGTKPRTQTALPYRIECCDADSRKERVLARAATAQLARAIFRAATAEHPESRITLRRGARIISDSRAEQSPMAPQIEAGT